MRQQKFILVFTVFAMMLGVAAFATSVEFYATFKPESDQPEPGKPFSFAVNVTNSGSAVNPAGNRLSVSRHSVSPGGQIDGYGVKIGGFSGQPVPEINPGQSTSLDFTDSRPPQGSFVYRIKFSQGGRYDNKEMYVTYERPTPVKFSTSGSYNAQIHAEYDVREQYPEPGDDFRFSVNIANKGNSESPANRLSISKHTVSSGGRIDNYGSLLGGSGGAQAIDALAPEESTALTFEDPRPAPGVFVYRMKFSSGGSYRTQEMTVTFARVGGVEIR